MSNNIVNRINALHRQLDALAAGQQHITDAAHHAAMQRAEAQARAYRAEKNPDGSLRRPHLSPEIENQMLDLARAHQASGKPLPEIDELYHAATWSHPATRAKLLSAQAKARPAPARPVPETLRGTIEQAAGYVPEGASMQETSLPGGRPARSPRTVTWG